MFDYIYGKIDDVESNYISLNCNNIGYKVFVGNPYSFEIDKEYKVYLYNHIREDEYSLYGFKTKEERTMFLSLIDVKGLGPKMALPMLAIGSINGILDAIERENILYLKKFPKIGEKVARQIILDLKGKVSNISSNIDIVSNDELISVLESLGYKTIDIKRVLPEVDLTKKIEEQVKEALKLLMK